MKILKKFQNKYILASTIANLVAILVLIGVIDVIKADLVIKIAGLVIVSLTQIGVLTNVEDTKE